jgi:hypothetical protein
MEERIPQNIFQAIDIFKTPCAILTGAGISVPMPSGLPLQFEILKSLMNLDWFEGNEKFPFTDENIITKINSALRLEHILSIFHEWGGHDPGKLITQFRDTPPNWYHHQIAFLAKNNYIRRIFTTNFDICLEKALDIQQVPYIQIADKSDYARADAGALWVIKLHGTVCPPSSKIPVKGLVSTLESMRIKTDDWKIQCLSESINHFGLICLGYSGRDSFDINPVLRRKKEQRILWVNHKTANSATSSTNSEINHTLQFSQFKVPVEIDTTTFLGKTQDLKRNSEVFQFNQVYSISENCHPSIFIGKVLENIQDYSTAKNYYFQVLLQSTGEHYFMSEIIDMNRALAVCHYELGEYNNALFFLKVGRALLDQYCEQLTANGRKPLDFEIEIILKHSILLYEESWLSFAGLKDKESFLEMENLLFDALSQFESLFGVETAMHSRLMLNRGSMHLDFTTEQNDSETTGYEQIIQDLTEAYQLKCETGDVIGIILTLALLGKSNTMLNKIDDAADWMLSCFSEIRKISSSIPTTVIDMVAGIICVIYFYKYSVNYTPNNKFVHYKNIDQSLKTRFNNRVKELLSTSLIESLNRADFYSILARDKSLYELFRQISDPYKISDDLIDEPYIGYL